MSGRPTKKRKVPTGFGDRLEQAIIASEKTYAEIERDIKVDHSNLHAYISETMAPTAFNLYALCKYLNVSADWLLGLESKAE